MMESLLYDVMVDALEKARDADVGERFCAMVYWLREMSATARTQGLLVLEDAVRDVPREIGLYREIQWVALLIVDGTDPETVRELSANRYWASSFQGEDALLYYMLIFGFLKMQSGVNPWRLERILAGWLPWETLYDQYDSYSERMDAPKVAAQKEILLNHNPVFENQEMMAAQKLLEEKILQMDREMLIHMLCQEIEHIDLVFALYGLSLAAKQKLFSVMSEKKVDEFAAIWAGWREGRCEDSPIISESTVQEALERLLAAFEKRKLPVKRYEGERQIYDAVVEGFVAGIE